MNQLQRISDRLLQRVQDELYRIFEGDECEITDEPEGPWSICEHVTHQTVSDLEELEIKAEQLAELIRTEFGDARAESYLNSL